MRPSVDIQNHVASTDWVVRDPQPTSRRPSPALWVWAATFALTGVASTLPGAILPTLVQFWHLHDNQSGVLLAALFCGSFTGTLFLSAHLRRTLTVGSCAAATGFFIFAASTVSKRGFLCAFAGLFIVGFGIGQMSSSINIIVGRSRSNLSRSVNLSLLAAAWCIGAILSPFCAAQLETSFKLEYRLALLGLLCLLPFAALPSASSVAPPVNIETAPTSRFSRDTVLFVLFFFVYGGTEACFTGWLPLYAGRIGFTSVLASRWIVSLLWLGMACGRLMSRAPLKRLDECLLLRLTLFGSTALAVLLLCLRNSSAFAVGCLLLGVLLGPCFPLALSIMLGKSLSPRQVGIVLAACALGCASLPAALGIVSNAVHSLRAALLLPLVALSALAFSARALQRTP